MTKYQHECNGARFEIEVDGLTLSDESPARFFVAHIRKVGGEKSAIVVEKGTCQREVYGQTEAWALKNAKALVDRENWTMEDEPVRRVAHLPEPMSV